MDGIAIIELLAPVALPHPVVLRLGDASCQVNHCRQRTQQTVNLLLEMMTSHPDQDLFVVQTTSPCLRYVSAKAQNMCEELCVFCRFCRKRASWNELGYRINKAIKFCFVATYESKMSHILSEILFDGKKAKVMKDAFLGLVYRIRIEIDHRN